MIIENNTARLNDIIFANRNKNYGAFAIRSSYDNTIIKSLVITGLIFASISTLAIALSNTAPVEEKIDIGTNTGVDVIYTVTDVQITPPKQKTELPIEKPTAPLAITIAIPTVIKDEKKEEKKDVIETIESTAGVEAKTNPTATDGGGVTGGDPNANATRKGNEGLNTAASVEPLIAPDVMPKFDDMAAFLGKNLRYPEMAREADISGKVYVNFIIDENGNVLKSTILNGIGYGCNEEALRVIKLMPKWTPGMNNGKRVKVSFNQIIYFMLKH